MARSKLKDLKSQIKKNKSVFITYAVLRIIVVLILIRSLFRADYQSAFYCVLTLILFFIPAFMEKNFGIVLPNTLEIFILGFVFAAEILGELNCYYLVIPHWDTMLHTINGFLCAAFGFCLIDILTRNKNLKFSLSPIYMAIAAFCFSMTIGVLWEFFEFSADCLLGTDMQKDTVITVINSVTLNPSGENSAVSIKNITETVVNGEVLPINGYLDIGLFDTMKDLMVNFIGAVVFSAIGYCYVKARGKGRFAKHFIPEIIEESSDFDSKGENETNT